MKGKDFYILIQKNQNSDSLYRKQDIFKVCSLKDSCSKYGYVYFV